MPTVRAKEYQQVQSLVANHSASPNLSWTAGPKTDEGRAQAFVSVSINKQEEESEGRGRALRGPANGGYGLYL